MNKFTGKIYIKIKLKIKIKRILRKLFRYLNPDYWNTKDIIILVYNASKVGSSTVYYNLKEKLPFLTVLHVHFLSETWLRSFEKSGKWLNNLRSAKSVNSHLEQNKTKRIKIITLVRDPIARDISAVFQSWQTIFDLKRIEELNMEEIRMHLNNSAFDQTENWFSSEFLEYTGIDILSLPFNKSKGYSIYNIDQYDILCIKTESLNKVMDSALYEFIGVKNISSKVKNSSKEKEGAELYKEIAGSFKLEKLKIEQIYSTIFMKHFYQDTELEMFKKRWTENW